MRGSGNGKGHSVWLITDRLKVKGKRLKEKIRGREAGSPECWEAKSLGRLGGVLRGAGNGEAHSARGIAYG